MHNDVILIKYDKQNITRICFVYGLNAYRPLLKFVFQLIATLLHNAQYKYIALYMEYDMYSITVQPV